MKKKLIVVILILLGVVLLWRIGILVFSGNNGKSGRSGRPGSAVAVEIDSVGYGTIREVRQLTGTVFPQYQYIVAPKVSGRIISIRKRIGDWVKAGEVIARIDDAEYLQGVIEAEANLKIAEASLAESRIQFDLAKQDKERVVQLQAKGISSSSELDAAVSNYSAQESRLELARAQVEQRQASLKSAKIRLSYTVLSASKPGLVGERFVDEGTLLAPNSAVLSIIGIDSVIVRTTIAERDYGHIKNGQPAKVIVDAFESGVFYGTVSRIAPMLEETSRMAQMEIEVANDSLVLKPGMFSRVEITTAEKENALNIPSRAVVNREGTTGVFMVSNDRTTANFVPVTTGIITPDRTEVLSPRISGLVVTLGQHLLNDGCPVLLPEVSGENKEIAGTPEGKKGR